MSKGKLFVISGASGVGKGTVLAKVMAAREDLRFSVSATTRDPRPGEVDGVHYYFVTKENFEDMIRKGDFIEYEVELDDGQNLIVNEYTKDTTEVHADGERVFLSFDPARISLYQADTEEVLSL